MAPAAAFATPSAKGLLGVLADRPGATAAQLADGRLGLGLYIARRLARANRGELAVSDPPGGRGPISSCACPWPTTTWLRDPRTSPDTEATSGNRVSSQASDASDAYRSEAGFSRSGDCSWSNVGRYWTLGTAPCTTIRRSQQCCSELLRAAGP
jgi:hypothetical protein